MHLLLPLAIVSQASYPNTLGANLMKMSLEELMEIRIDNVYIAAKNLRKNNQINPVEMNEPAIEIKNFDYGEFLDILNNPNSFYITYDPINYYLEISDIDRPVDSDDRIILFRDCKSFNKNVFKTRN